MVSVRKDEPGRKFTLRLEADLHSKLVAFAERDMRSLHAEIITLLEDAVAAEADQPGQVTLSWRGQPQLRSQSSGVDKEPPPMKFVTIWLRDSLHSNLVGLAQRDNRSLHAEIVVFLERAVLALERSLGDPDGSLDDLLVGVAGHGRDLKREGS